MKWSLVQARQSLCIGQISLDHVSSAHVQQTYQCTKMLPASLSAVCSSHYPCHGSVTLGPDGTDPSVAGLPDGLFLVLLPPSGEKEVTSNHYTD